MKNLTMGLALLMAMTTVQAGEKVDKTLKTPADGLVQIENVRGKIKVLGWERNEVAVKGELDSETEKFIFESTGATTTIKVQTPNNLNRGQGSDLVIHLPLNSRLRVNLVSADLQLAGVHGGVEGNTVSGNVNASDLRNRIELSSVSGDIELKDSEGETELSTVSGGIRAQVDTESVSLSTVSGDASIASGLKVKELDLNTVSGDVEVRAQLSSGASVDGSTVSGDLRLFVNKDLDAVIDISTAGGGEVINGLSEHRPERGMIGNESLGFTLGNGKGEIDLTTVSGRLELQPL